MIDITHGDVQRFVTCVLLSLFSIELTYFLFELIFSIELTYFIFEGF
jgi:hypothetical protein